MGISIFPAASAGGNSNLTTTDLVTNSASVPKLTKQATYNSSASGLTYPAGTNWVYAFVIGGGGGGQGVGSGTNANTYAKGGFAGAVSFGVSKPAVTVTVGAGGNGGSSAGNTEGKTGGTGGSSMYGQVYAQGGDAGYGLYYGNTNNNHMLGYSTIISGRTVIPGPYFTNVSTSSISGSNSLENYNAASQGDIYAYVANGATGAQWYTNVPANSAVGLPSNINGYSGGARAGGNVVSGNERSPLRGGGGAGFNGAGGAAAANAAGAGGAGGGGGGGCGPVNNYDFVNGNWVNTTFANGGAGGAGVVELYY